MNERAFELFPAIDLRGGRVVRLRQGEASTEIRFSGDPVAVARQLAEAGAAALHVVDLDGAFGGAPAQLSTVARICRVARIPVRLGGGLRREQDLDAAFAAGISVAIVGTTAVEEPDRFRAWVSKFGGRLAGSLDVRGGLVRTRGWVSETAFRLEDAAAFLAEAGLRDLVVTDVERDGELSGPDIELFHRAAEAFGSPVVAAGGISSSEDVERLRASPSIRGAVLGRALYEGRIPLSIFSGPA
ncbi:MAG: 1-(5-phosphoribosyl)-5-[(5-phosphoribosylamino)methylideneamino] imidazole-4-carboxamide isomerase [Acidobacteriota bacterium]